MGDLSLGDYPAVNRSLLIPPYVQFEVNGITEGEGDGGEMGGGGFGGGGSTGDP